jgi:hypothetical protein
MTRIIESQLGKTNLEKYAVFFMHIARNSMCGNEEGKKLLEENTKKLFEELNQDDTLAPINKIRLACRINNYFNHKLVKAWPKLSNFEQFQDLCDYTNRITMEIYELAKE